MVFGLPSIRASIEGIIGDDKCMLFAHESGHQLDKFLCGFDMGASHLAGEGGHMALQKEVTVPSLRHMLLRKGFALGGMEATKPWDSEILRGFARC